MASQARWCLKRTALNFLVQFQGIINDFVHHLSRRIKLHDICMVPTKFRNFGMKRGPPVHQRLSRPWTGSTVLVKVLCNPVPKCVTLLSITSNGVCRDWNPTLGKIDVFDICKDSPWLLFSLHWNWWWQWLMNHSCCCWCSLLKDNGDMMDWWLLKCILLMFILLLWSIAWFLCRRCTCTVENKQEEFVVDQPSHSTKSAFLLSEMWSSSWLNKITCQQHLLTDVNLIQCSDMSYQ